MGESILIGQKDEGGETFFHHGVNTDEWYQKKKLERQLEEQRKQMDKGSNDMKFFDVQHKPERETFNFEEGEE